MPSVIGILALLIPVLVLFTLTTASLVPAAATVFCWGLLAFALVSPLQMRVVNEAAQAPNLASTQSGAFNLGNAAGAWRRRPRPDPPSGLSRVAVDRRGSGRCRVHAQLSLPSARRKGVRRRRAGRRAMTVESTSLGSDSHLRELQLFTCPTADSISAAVSYEIPKSGYICNSGRALGPRRARPANNSFTEVNFNQAWLAES